MGAVGWFIHRKQFSKVFALSIISRSLGSISWEKLHPSRILRCRVAAQRAAFGLKPATGLDKLQVVLVRQQPPEPGNRDLDARSAGQGDVPRRSDGGRDRRFQNRRLPGDGFRNGRHGHGGDHFRQRQELLGKFSQERKQLRVLADQRNQPGEEHVNGDRKVVGHGIGSWMVRPPLVLLLGSWLGRFHLWANRILTRKTKSRKTRRTLLRYRPLVDFGREAALVVNFRNSVRVRL